MSNILIVEDDLSIQAYQYKVRLYPQCCTQKKTH